MRNSKLYMVALLSSTMSYSVNAEVTGSLTSGYDTNPFKLSDALPIDEAGFVETDLRFNQSLASGLSVDIRADLLVHGDIAEDADMTTLSGALEWEYEGDLSGKKATYDARIRYSDQDKTYVSRTTGLRGEFGGEDITDRYDASWFDGRARVDVDLREHLSLRVAIEARNKEYEDYTAVGMSNLDYAQWSGTGTLRFRPDKQNDMKASLGYGLRTYDNRAGRDLAGATVAGSDLEYTFTDFDVSWKHSLPGDQDIKTSYTFKTREDNVSGYFDTTTNAFALRYRKEVSDKQKLVANITYTDYKYDNLSALAIVENEEPVGPKDGFRVSLSYEYELPAAGKSEWVMAAGLSHADYDSPNPVYAYDRTRVWVSIEAKF